MQCLLYFIIKYFKQIFQSVTRTCISQFRERNQSSIQFTRTLWSLNQDTEVECGPVKAFSILFKLQGNLLFFGPNLP